MIVDPLSPTILVTPLLQRCSAHLFPMFTRDWTLNGRQRTSMAAMEKSRGSSVSPSNRNAKDAQRKTQRNLIMGNKQMYHWLVVSTPLKIMSSSIGMMTFQISGKVIQSCSKSPTSIYIDRNHRYSIDHHGTSIPITPKKVDPFTDGRPANAISEM